MYLDSKQSLPILLSIAVAISISGCAEKRSCQAAVKPQVPKLHVMDDKDRQIQALQIAIAEARARQGQVITKTVLVDTVDTDSIYPPNAQPGKCYKKVLLPAKFKNVTEKMLSNEASHKVEVIPARYRNIKKKILVKEASSRLVAVPATYKKVTEKILVREANTRLVKIPAKYTTKTEKIKVSEASTNWKKANCSGGDCGTMCLVTTPARYKTVTKKVVAQPATTKSIPVPPVYKTVTRTVIDRPATTKSVPIAPIYKTVTVKELIEPAKVKTIDIPERYTKITKKVQVSPSSLKWTESSCKSTRVAYDSPTTTKKVNVKQLQTALRDAGVSPGPIDGIFGKLTRSALIKYQKSNDLVAGKLSRETLNSLGMM